MKDFDNYENYDLVEYEEARTRAWNQGRCFSAEGDFSNEEEAWLASQCDLPDEDD